MNAHAYDVASCAVLIGALPPLLIYFFGGKYFVRGLTPGRDQMNGRNMATLTISQLYKRFGAVEVLKGIELEAKTGEFIALVGPSGCGKSTLLAMIAGLETVTEGEIRIDGALVNSVAPKDRDIAMVFQSYALYPTMTVAAEHHLRHGKPRRAEGRAGRGGQARRRASADRAAAQPQARPALRRPAPARGDGPRAGARPEALPVRRTALQPRRQAPRRDAHRDQEAAPARSARRRSTSPTTRSRR